MITSTNDKKTKLDQKASLHSQTYNQYLQKQDFQPTLSLSLPSPPLLQFKRQKKYETSGDSTKQQTENKRPLDNSQQIAVSLKEVSLNHIKLQKDYINAIQPSWIESVKTSIDSYLAFQNKMIMLYVQLCNIYLKNIYNAKTKQPEKKKEKLESDKVEIQFGLVSDLQ